VAKCLVFSRTKSKRSKRVSIRVSDDDLEAIDTVAKSFNCTRSEAIREAVHFVAFLIREAKRYGESKSG